MADDTPDGLRERSALHGAMSLTVRKRDGKDLVQSIKDLPEIDRSEVVRETDSDTTIRLFPKRGASLSDSGADRIVRHLFENGFHIETFFTEKGRLDEVFRMVTGSDTMMTDRVS